MASERQRSVPDEGGPEVIRGLADHYTAEAESDRRELVRRDRARLEILAGFLARIDGFPGEKVIYEVVDDEGNKSEQERDESLLLVIHPLGDDGDDMEGWEGYEEKVYLEPDGTLALYYWTAARMSQGVTRVGPLSGEKCLQHGQKAIEVAGARIKEVLAAQAVQA